METNPENSSLEPVKKEVIYWYDFLLGNFQKNFKRTRRVLIIRKGKAEPEYARYIEGDVFLECSGVDGGSVITSQVIRIAEMPVG